VLSSSAEVWSACIGINSGCSLFDIRNNILRNSLQPVSGSYPSKTFAIINGNSAGTFTNINNNDYYVNGVGPNIGYQDNIRPTLTAWQTATGQDSASVNIDPMFTSATNLIPTSVPLYHQGVYLPAVPSDINHTSRTNPPDIGAYEYAPDPMVNTTAAGGIAAFTATLNGTINANSLNVGSSFEYGTTTAYGTIVAGTPATVTGNVFTPISASVSGLTPSTLYHFRARGVVTPGGLIAYGPDMTFYTDAGTFAVVTNPASNITTTGAQLNGSVSTNSLPANVSFEWGLTTAYGSVVAGVPALIPGNSSLSSLATLTGLLTNTTYHYRCVAVNSIGTVYGLDQSFVTGCPLPAPAGPITGPASVCAFSAGNVYSVGTIANAQSYTWTLPAGAVITSGAGTNTITVTFDSVSGNVTVAGTGTCGTGTSSSLSVTVNPQPLPTIGTTSNPCLGSTDNLYFTESGMTGYVWTVSAGGTIMSGQGTETVMVAWMQAGAQTVSVTYTNSSGCTAVTPTQYAVYVNSPPNAAGAITGSTSVCAGTNGVTYSTDPIAGATSYSWSVPAGATIASGSGTTSIVVNFGPTAGSGTITVAGTNQCGNGAISPDFMVTMNAIPDAPVVTSAGNILTSSAATGNQWYYEGNAIPGATGQIYMVINNTGFYWCVVTINGCSSPISNKVWLVVTGQQELQNSKINVYPVPNTGLFTISFESASPESYTISIYNNIGVKIYEIKDIRVNGYFEQIVELKQAVSGVYTIILRNSENQIVRKMIVQD
jgi:hypothetical protein